MTRTALPTIVETPLIAGAANIGPRQKVDSVECRDIDRRVAELDVAEAAVEWLKQGMPTVR